MLQEQEGLAVQKCEGRVGPYPSHTWGLWFRYSFKLSQPCRLELDLGLPGDALLKAASLVMLDNDTSQVSLLLKATALIVLDSDTSHQVLLSSTPAVLLVWLCASM